MRRIPLLIGLSLLLAPFVASAADCSLLESAQPISPYVEKILSRADQGMTYASEAQANEDFFPFYLPWWGRSIAGTFAELVDSRQRLTERESDLENTTACLRYDQILVECRMDSVRQALDDALRRGSFVAIMRLQSLLLFLQERLGHLAQGASDYTYNDPSWERQWLFDREKPEALEEPLCPFDSDYTPARMTGYGCDVTVLQNIISGTSDGALSFAEAELQSLDTIDREIAEFRRIIPLLQTVESQSQLPADSSPEPEHKTILGCQGTLGVCSDDNELVCGTDEFCASKGKGRCLPNDTVPAIPTHALRGPFSFGKNHLQLLIDFVDKRIEDGLSRTFPANWTTAGDATDEDVLLSAGRATMRIVFRSISGIQGRLEGTIFPETTDSQLEIADALSDMRASIGELSRLASTKTGVRSFVIDLAYFLRRTCAFRPCQKSLEQIIRIGLEDACFPYTDGDFLNDSPDDPRWKKCAEAACIGVDGTSLSGNCQEILP